MPNQRESSRRDLEDFDDEFGGPTTIEPRMTPVRRANGSVIPFAGPRAIAARSNVEFRRLSNSPRNTMLFGRSAPIERLEDDQPTLITSSPYPTRMAHGTPAPVVSGPATTPISLFPRAVTPAPARATTVSAPSPAPWTSSGPENTFISPAYVPELPVLQDDPGNTYLPTVLPAVAPMPVIAEPNVAPAPGQWATYGHLGLGAPKPSKQRVGKLIVSLYRLLGFSILTIIVVVLVGYITTTTFYYLNTTWITPIAISASDEKVVALETQLAERQNLRDRLAADLVDADRAIAQQQAFQIEFGKAIESDLAGRKLALQKMRSLAFAAAGTRAHITSTNKDFADHSKIQAERELEANLITRDQMLANKYQLAQIEGANFSLAERQAEFEQRAAELALQSKSLSTLLDKAANKTPLSYDVLKIKQEFDNSKLALDKLVGARETLKASLVREDKIVDGLRGSSYLRAVNDRATVAFVPYSNMHNMSKGDELFGCKFGMVMCHKVGTVIEVLAGEVSFKHPHRDKMMRGQMVELKLEDGSAAEEDVLFVGDKPLWL